MTTGNTTVDTRSSVVASFSSWNNGTSTGTVRVGSYRNRTWSGANRTTSLVKEPARYRYYTSINAAGKSYTGKFRINPTPTRARKDSPHAYSMSWVTRNHTLYNLFQQGKGTQSYMWWRDTGTTEEARAFNIPSPPGISSNQQLALLNKLKESIDGSDFNFATFLGEGHQTLTMIGDTAIKLANAYKAARKGNFAYAAAILNRGRKPTGIKKSQANNWLQLQYGWLPLLSDIHSGAELLAHQLNVPFKKRYVVRTSNKRSRAEIQKITGGGNWSYQDMRSASYRQLVAYVSEPPTVAQLSGILDPERVVWELTPFSFVADWVIPIGDYLEARAFAGKLQGTFVITDINRRSRRNYRPESSVYTISCDDKSFYEVGNMTRTVSNNLHAPRPNVKSLDKVLSWQHCANAIALLVQSVK